MPVWSNRASTCRRLAGGHIAGLWRPRKKGKRLVVVVEAFAPLSSEVRSEIEAEAALLAPYRACASAEVAFAGETVKAAYAR